MGRGSRLERRVPDAVCCVGHAAIGGSWRWEKRVNIRQGWRKLGVGRVAHASTRFCSNFILLFQKSVSNHFGPPLLLWTKQNCETHTELSTRLPWEGSRINIIRGYLHIHPHSCGSSSQRDMMQIKSVSVSLALRRRMPITSKSLRK